MVGAAMFQVLDEEEADEPVQCAIWAREQAIDPTGIAGNNGGH